MYLSKKSIRDGSEGSETKGKTKKDVEAMCGGGYEGAEYQPAGIVARELNIRNIDTVCAHSYSDDNAQAEEVKFLKLPKQAMEDKGEGWLAVDDLVDSGKTAREIRNLMPHIHIATVYGKPNGINACDTFVREFTQDTWVHFPWDLDIQYVKPAVIGGE